MSPQQVIEHFGSQTKTAEILGCGQSTVAGWLEQGYVPPGRQAQIQLLTGGQLTAEAQKKNGSRRTA